MVSVRSAIAAALREFRSVKRRLEVKAEIHGITIIDDFAHHPTAIAQTLKALRTRYCRSPLVGRPRAAFQYAAAGCVSARVGDKALQSPTRLVLADVFKSEAIPRGRAAGSGSGCRGFERQRQAGATARQRRRDRRCNRSRDYGVAMWSRSSPTAASAESTRSCRQG